MAGCASASPSAVPSTSVRPASSAVSSPGASASPEVPTIDTSGWSTYSMPFLGYSLALPPTWERVTSDPDAPVPSIAVIAGRDEVTAQALQAAAEQVAAGGLFASLGLWAVDPASLLQVGLLAGSPYRVTAEEFDGGVEQSVLDRASDQMTPIIGPVSFPAGDGFQAVYLDGTDLSEHREIHLRTPNGRYLLLASTYPGLAEPELAATVLAIAESIRPLPGAASGDRPAPSMGPDGNADPALAALLPEVVGGVVMTRRSLDGESLVGDGISAGGTVAGEFGRLVSAPGDVTVALAVPAGEETSILIAGYRFRGVEAAAVRDLLAGFPPQIWSTTTVGGREVLTSIADATGSRTYLRVGEGAGSGILFQVQATDPDLAAEALAGLP